MQPVTFSSLVKSCIHKETVCLWRRSVVARRQSGQFAEVPWEVWRGGGGGERDAFTSQQDHPLYSPFKHSVSSRSCPAGMFCRGFPDLSGLAAFLKGFCLPLPNKASYPWLEPRALKGMCSAYTRFPPSLPSGYAGSATPILEHWKNKLRSFFAWRKRSSWIFLLT